MSEILKEEIERFFKEKSVCILKEENKRLQAENERLKEKLNEWEKELQSNEKIINSLIKENEELKKYEYYYLDKFIELKQALEEIRGIIHKHIPVNIESFRKAEELPPVALGLQKILFKVDEVLK